VSLPSRDELGELVQALRQSPGWEAKRDLQFVAKTSGGPAGPANGDDCAAFPDGAGGYLLLAAEAMWPELVRSEPFFAGYCSVMVNVSDVAAMGGRPLGLVDTLWTDGPGRAGPLWDGLCEGARRFGVPLAGGHTNVRSPYDALGVAILGRAQRLITSFDARPGDALVAAIDLRGEMHPRHAFWNASHAPASRLQGDLALLPRLAEEGLCLAGKDISMAGVLGSLLMLLECSRVGAVVDLSTLPRPPALSRDFETELRWLRAFPSFGFVLAVAPEKVAAVCETFAARDIAAGVVGTVHEGSTVSLRSNGARATLWDFADAPFMGFPGRQVAT
jgi:AIR synthase-related protein